MKQILLISCLLMMIANVGNAELPLKDPGKKITERFVSDFPLAGQVDWTKNDNGDFIANFIQDNKSYQAYYNESGEYLGQGWHTELKNLSDLAQQEIIRFSTSTSQIKSIYLFLPAAGFPKYYTTVIRKNKEIILKTDSYGETTVVDKKKLPFKK